MKLKMRVTFPDKKSEVVTFDDPRVTYAEALAEMGAFVKAELLNEKEEVYQVIEQIGDVALTGDVIGDPNIDSNLASKSQTR